MTLTNSAIRRAQPKERPHKLGDSRGLCLFIQPRGRRLWRLKYRLNGSAKKLGLGIYPEVTLTEAPAKADEAGKIIADGFDPGLEKQRAKARAQLNASNLFGDIAREYIEKRRSDGLSSAPLQKANYFLAPLSPSLG